MPVISERGKELKRRRHRRKTYSKFKAILAKNPSADMKAHIADKLRKMTPSAEMLIEEWKLLG
ncbi:DUF6800 family protein [Blastopirellula marina]|uniref:30S ribosomal protein S20 n=1 Tax=Blastopirellula marina TaxID=124 RepID=A0A2S8GMZ1_9BACT|nr:DUF6800 family protein [Blastopirellula marina]PQO45731.1 hypothetical protein C5Y93_12445 [Blastopirellula marina]